MLTRRRVSEISEQVAGESLFHYFCGRSPVDVYHPLLRSIYGDEPLRSKTALQGLLTSLGVTLWERLANRLACENDFEVQDPKEIKQPEVLPSPHRELLSSWSDKRRVGSEILSLQLLSEELKDDKYSVLDDHLFKKLNKSDGIDVFLTKGDTDFYFDIKTVDWNTGSSYKFNAALLNWIIFHRIQRPDYKLQPYFVIPYGIPKNWWDEVGPKVSPLQEGDILIGNAFWDLITGLQDTLRYITKGFDSFAKRDGIRAVYSRLLTEASPDLDLQLIRLHRNVRFVSNVQTMAGKPSRYKENWECLNCGSHFVATRKSIINDLVHCHYCGVTH